MRNYNNWDEYEHKLLYTIIKLQIELKILLFF